MRRKPKPNSSRKPTLICDMNKEYILCSAWGPKSNCRATDDLKFNLVNKCGLPEFISKRIVSVIIKERTVATSWFSSFKLGRVGKTATVVDFYVVVSGEGLSDAQRCVVDGFWVGFLSGRDSKKFFY